MKKTLILVIFILSYQNIISSYNLFNFKYSKLKPKGIIKSTSNLTLRRYEKSKKKVLLGVNFCSQKISLPITGILTSRFGIRRKKMHKGIDIYAKTGSVIKSASSGEVIFSGKKNGYGNVVIIQHSLELKTLYAHNQENLVKKGDKIKEGQPLALLGSTGNATGPHLHFEVLIDDVQVNPEIILNCKFNFSKLKLKPEVLSK